MAKARKYSPEVRERAVRLVFEHQEEYASQWAAISSIAEKIGCTPETLRSWVRRAERDTGRRPGLTTDERAHLKELEREVRELRRPSMPSSLRAGCRRERARHHQHRPSVPDLRAWDLSCPRRRGHPSSADVDASLRAQKRPGDVGCPLRVHLDQIPSSLESGYIG